MVNARYFSMDYSALILDHLGLQLDKLWAYKASYTFHETSPVSMGESESQNLAPCCQHAPMALCPTVGSLVASASAGVPVGSLGGQAWLYHCLKFSVNLFKGFERLCLRSHRVSLWAHHGLMLYWCPKLSLPANFVVFGEEVHSGLLFSMFAFPPFKTAALFSETPEAIRMANCPASC